MKRMTSNILLAMAVMLLSSLAEARQNLPKPTHKMRCSLPEVLWEIGNKYNIYFTIENDATHTTTVTKSTEWSRALYVGLSNDRCTYLQDGASDVNRELQAIQSDLPDFGFAIDGANPHVVHVFNTRLISQAAYPMVKTIGPIQFKGTEAELVYWLHRQGVGVAFGSSFDDKGDPRFNVAARHAHTTQVDINIQTAPVREVLSTFAPGDKNERILWMSMAGLGPPDTVYISFGFRWYKDHVHGK